MDEEFDLGGVFEATRKALKENGVEDFLTLYQNKRIPEKIDPAIFLKSHPIYKTVRYDEVQDLTTALHGYARVTYEWIDPLIEEMEKYTGKPRSELFVLEVCAGNAAFSCALKNRGVQCVATDDYSDMWSFKDEQEYTDVERLDMMRAFLKYGQKADFIFCGWPYSNSSIEEILCGMRGMNQKCVLLYLGGIGCAVESFFSAAVPVNGFDCDRINAHYHNFEDYCDKLQAFQQYMVIRNTVAPILLKKREMQRINLSAYSKSRETHDEYIMYAPEYDPLLMHKVVEMLYSDDALHSVGFVEAYRVRSHSEDNYLEDVTFYVSGAVDPKYEEHGSYIMKTMLKGIVNELYLMNSATRRDDIIIVGLFPKPQYRPYSAWQKMDTVIYELRAQHSRSIIVPNKEKYARIHLNSEMSKLIPFHLTESIKTEE